MPLTPAIFEAFETGEPTETSTGDDLYDFVFDQVCDKPPQHPGNSANLEAKLHIARSV